MKMITTRRAFVITALAGLAAGCSRRGRIPAGSLEPEEGYGQGVVERRILIDQITALDIQQTPSGVIIKATGLGDAQGYWNPGLVTSQSNEEGSSELRLDFRVYKPFDPVTTGAEVTREIIAAHTMSNQALSGIRTITVVGERNTRSIRR